MAPVTANAAKHKIGWYYEQARDTAADIGVLLLISAGVVGDDAMADYVTVAALLGGTSDEATFTNYARKIVTPQVTVDNALNRVVLTMPGAQPVVSWPNAGTAGAGVNNTLARIVFYYDPAPGSTPDSGLAMLTIHQISATTDGTQLDIQVEPTTGIVLVKASSTSV